MPKHPPYLVRRSEHGNAFFIILLGVVLFAALSFTIARGMRSEGTNNLTKRQADLAASDIITYGQRLERGISQLRRRNISENDISFANPVVTGYAHGTPQPEENKVFHFSGSAVSWKEPPPRANDASTWHFTGSTCIAGVGNGAAGCSSDTVSNEELLAVLPNLTQSVCEALNSRLGIGTTPADSGGGYSTTKFTGTFADGTEIVLASPYQSACFSKSGAFHYYTVLLAR